MNQRLTLETPTVFHGSQSPLDLLCGRILAPPKPQNENAAPSAKGNGVKFETEAVNFTKTLYQKAAESQVPSAIEARRLDLLRNGYRPIPVEGKRPQLSGWQNSQADEWDVRKWTKGHASARNTGIVLGEKLVAIDVDILDADVSAPLLDAADDLGDGAPLVRIGQAPKTLLLFRTDRPLKKRTTGKYRRNDAEKEQGVEILAAGQQFVCNGIHPDTDQPYLWLGESPLDVAADDLPLIDHEKLDVFMRMADERLSRTGWQKIKPASGEPKPVADDYEDLFAAPKERLSADRCKAILADLPAEWCESRDLWIRAGMALHHEFGGSPEGFAIWDTWSRKSAKYDASAIKRDWRSFRGKAHAVTIATLIAAARDAELERMFDDLGDDEPEQPAKSAKPSNLTFLSPADCAAMPSRGYVIKGFIAPSDVACIFGEPGAGKSMIAPFLGYAVAQGREAFGMRTKPGKVFYLPMEDESGMQMRVRALREQHGDTEDFFVVRGVAMHNDDGLKDLLREVKRQRPALIVRIPMKPAIDSETKPATHSDFIPASIPI